MQTAALAALNSYSAPIYGSGMVNVSAALGLSLGLPGMTGTTSTGNACNLPATGCYVSNDYSDQCSVDVLFPHRDAAIECLRLFYDGGARD